MVDMNRTDKDRAEPKARILTVGRAEYTADGRPSLTHWVTEGGLVGYHADAYGPDDVVMVGWTFRELHAIANGTGPNVERVREVDELPATPCPDMARQPAPRMTADASLPPADVQRPTPPLTEAELAEVAEAFSGSPGVVIRRLIADLRASHARIKELEAKLAWVDERIDSGEL